MEKSPRITIDTTEEMTTLTVKNTMLDDSGLYTVEAENVVGKAVADFEVNVQGKLYYAKVIALILVNSIQGPVVQSIVSLISLLVVKISTVLVSAISNSQLFLLKKCECKSYSHFFSKKISAYMP